MGWRRRTARVAMGESPKKTEARKPKLKPKSRNNRSEPKNQGPERGRYVVQTTVGVEPDVATDKTKPAPPSRLGRDSSTGSDTYPPMGKKTAARKQAIRLKSREMNGVVPPQGCGRRGLTKEEALAVPAEPPSNG